MLVIFEQKLRLYFFHCSEAGKQAKFISIHLSLSFLFEISANFKHSESTIDHFLERLRGVISPWIYSYDVSSHEIIAHTDLNCLDTDKFSRDKLLSSWRTKLGFDKREIMLVSDKVPFMQRILNGILISHADLVLVLSVRHNLSDKRVSLEDYVLKFQGNEKLCVLFFDIVNKRAATLERMFIVRRSCILKLDLSNILNSASPGMCDGFDDFMTALKRIVIESGYEVSVLGRAEFQRKANIFKYQIRMKTTRIMGMSGIFELKNHTEFTSAEDTLKTVTSCKEQLWPKFSALQKKKENLFTDYAKPGVSYLNTGINGEDNAKVEKIRTATRELRSKSSVTLAIEFFKHRENIAPLLTAYRKLIAQRGKYGRSDRIIILEDGGNDGSFEQLLKMLQGPTEMIICMNNIHEIRAYSRSLHISSTDIWVMLQDDDLPVTSPQIGENWLENALKMFDAYPSLGGISLLCSYTSAYVYGNTWGHCKASEGVPTIDPCTGVEFMFAISGDSSPLFYRRSALEESGGLLFSWSFPIQLQTDNFSFSADTSYSYMVGAEAEVAFRMWRNGYSWGSMRAPGIIRSFGGKATYHGIERNKALDTDLPHNMKWRRYLLWRQNRRMKAETARLYSFSERKRISVAVEELNHYLICRRPKGVRYCSIFRPYTPRSSVEYGKTPMEDVVFYEILRKIQVRYRCPLDKLAVVDDKEMLADRNLFGNKPWPGHKGNWVRCRYNANDPYWWMGERYTANDSMEGWIPSWCIPFLNLQKIEVQ